MHTTSQKVWLITGSSSGLGRELVLSVLARGDKVVATARTLDKLNDLQESYPEQCRILQLDVTDAFDILSGKAKEAISMWGRVDVLVNNAGHGLMGTIEEAGVEGFMKLYKTNVFGVINITNAFLPYMRQCRNGTVVIVGSRSGWDGRFAGGALYGSSKAAIHAISDILSYELRPQGIRVLTVVPGGLRTKSITNSGFIGKTALEFPSPGIEIGEVPEYAQIRARTQAILETINGAEPGDAKKAANVIVDVVRGEGVAEGRPPTETLFLGSDALRDVGAKCHAALKNIDEWGDVARSIDLDQSK